MVSVSKNRFKLFNIELAFIDFMSYGESVRKIKPELADKPRKLVRINRNIYF
jgi:hypothetical protein